MSNIIVTGANGRFASTLKKYFNGKHIQYLNKKKFNILKFNKIQKYLENFNIKTVIHLAGLSRPMSLHETKINQSIDANIIGTCNLVKACNNLNIKIVYISTNYVYPCTKKKGSYNEKDCLLPFNNYGWSKLGGETAVQMYKNSLILRICMTERPFVHKYAFKNVYSSFLYHDEVAKNFKNLIQKKGIINVGGKKKTIFQFVRNSNKKIIPKKSKINQKNQSLDVKKYNSILKRKNK